MVKKIVITVAALLVALGVLGGIKGMQIAALIAQGESFAPPPESVATDVVREDSWETVIDTVGSVEAVQGVTVSSEVPGIVRSIEFKAGAFARRGDVLVRLDVSTEEAQLEAAKAEADLAQISLSRANSLRSIDANSQAELDSASARARQAIAQVELIRAAISKKTVRAPFSGRLGVRQVDLGQFVNAGVAIVSLQSFSPVYVNFWLPQQRLAVLETHQTVRVTSDASEGEVFEGTVHAVNPEVDSSTRNVRVQAKLDNAAGKLRPGMFVDVDVVLPAKQPVLTVPATAVVYAPYGDSVYVVSEAEEESAGSPRHVAQQRFVRLGEKRGDLVAVSSGLNAGEKVVTGGSFKLRNGSPVVENNDLALDAKLSPSPTDS